MRRILAFAELAVMYFPGVYYQQERGTLSQPMD